MDIISNSSSICCRGCHEDLPVEKFYRNKRGLYGRQSVCKDCMRMGIRANEGWSPAEVELSQLISSRYMKLLEDGYGTYQRRING